MKSIIVRPPGTKLADVFELLGMDSHMPGQTIPPTKLLGTHLTLEVQLLRKYTWVIFKDVILKIDLN